jgi:hypothetical protein
VENEMIAEGMEISFLKQLLQLANASESVLQIHFPVALLVAEIIKQLGGVGVKIKNDRCQFFHELIALHKKDKRYVKAIQAALNIGLIYDSDFRIEGI